MFMRLTNVKYALSKRHVRCADPHGRGARSADRRRADGCSFEREKTAEATGEGGRWRMAQRS